MFDAIMSILLMLFLGAILTGCLHMVLISLCETWRQPYSKIKWREFAKKEKKNVQRKKTKR